MPKHQEQPEAGIAIIGMSCRWPGANSVLEFWDNLALGIESIAFFSDGDLRAAGVPDELIADPRYVKASPVLKDIESFDATFFEYSPREASLIDPQQRILLEVAWEAFEDAGYTPDDGAGVVGVFAGGGSVVTSYLVAHHGHQSLSLQTASLPHISNDKDFFATRVSFKLNLTGPSVTVQTACSTSLVALHLACRSIASGECDMALTGASSIRMPDRTGYLAEKGNIYSLDGHCRAFDGDGQGTIFGNGVAAILLKSVQRAIDDGDHIYAVIKGTAVNNDGARKISFAAPSSTGQTKAFIDAFARSGVDPDTIQYVECHATGTVVGDPVEIEALTHAFRRYTDRRGYCAVGSVKTNIGHPEQAAGFAGLMKAALSLRHGKIPASLNYRTPNPSIDFAGSPFYVNSELREWPRESAPRRALINSLGIGGTNAVAILEEAPLQHLQPTTEDWPSHLLTLSAKTEAALEESVRRMREHIAIDSSALFADVCYTSNVSRSSFSHRLAIVAADFADLTRQLELGPNARSSAHAATAGRNERRKVAFLFTGQGSQYFGMGRALYQANPLFRGIVDECASHLAPHLDVPILDVIFADERHGALLSQTKYTQPALFVIEYALAELWRELGVVPDAVLGHSIGEIVAACVAGVFEVRDALQFVAVRGRLMQQLPANGSMAVIFDDETNTRRLIADLDASVDVAALNGPSSTVIAGRIDAVAQVVRALDAASQRSQPLQVSHAFHSRLMESILGELRENAERIAHYAPRIPLISNVSGRLHEGTPDAPYWCRHARETVRFADGMKTLREVGCEVFIEVGPGVGLLSAGRSSVPHAEARWLGSLGKGGSDDWRAMLESVRQLYLEGVPIRWNALHAGRSRRRVSLPTYPFQRKRYWLDKNRTAPTSSNTSKRPAIASNARTSSPAKPSSNPASFAHPLLGPPIVAANHEIRFDARCSLADTPYLRDHQVHGVPVLPTVTALEAALAAGRAQLQDDNLALESVIYEEALVLPEKRGRPVELVLTPQGSDGAAFRLTSQDSHDPKRWRTHLSGFLRRASVDEKRAPDLATQSRCTDLVSPDEYYQEVRALGLDYGPNFRGVKEIRRGDREIIAKVALPANVSRDDYHVHPAFLDACLHVYPALINGHAKGEAYLPVGMERFYVNGGAASDAIAHAVLKHIDPGHGTAKIDIDVYDTNSELVASFGDLTVKQLPARGEQQQSRPDRLDWLYRLEWAELPPLARASEVNRADEHWVVFSDQGGVGRELARRLEGGGTRCTLVSATHKGKLKVGDANTLRVDATNPAQIEEVFRVIAAKSRKKITGAVYLWGLDVPVAARLSTTRLVSTQTQLLGGALHVAQAVSRLRQSQEFSGRVWFITRGTQSVRAHDAVEPTGATLWGFGRTLAIEHPGSWGGLVDLPIRKTASAHEDVRSIQVELGRQDGEDQVAIRGKSRYGARLRHLPSDERGNAIAIRSDATYLVTGGLGTIGLGIAQWLVGQGARSLVLTGRTGAKEGVREVLAALEEKGASIRIVRADVALEADVRTLFQLLRGGPPLRGVIHCAGVLDDGILAQMPWGKFETVLAPKTRGAWLLHRFTKQASLDFFVVQSSILSQIGSAGQANYTSANAFLDSLVAHRRALGLPATAINWGAWAEHGMAASAGARGEVIWRARGMRFIPFEPGIALFGDLLGRGLSDVTVTIMDWGDFVKERGARPALCRELASISPKQAAANPVESSRVATLPSNDPERGREWLTSFLAKEVGETLGIEGNLDHSQPLNELGLDSLMSVNLANRLERVLGATVPVGTLIRGTSITQIAAELLPRVKVPALEAPPKAMEVEVSELITPPSIQRRDVAIPPSREERSRTSPDRWLVFPRPNPGAKMRLFCFPFAGGGAAAYRPWVDHLNPGIELIAVEPPGHGSRMKERPLRVVEPYLKALAKAMAPYLDKPCALFGACLGGILAYEAARRLLMTGEGDPTHFFVAGARPPHKVSDFTPFEQELVKYTVALPEYDMNRPAYEQPDEVMGEYIRRFNMDAANEMLTRKELRKLLMPAIRADFEITSRYTPTPIAPWKLSITSFQGLEDPYVSHDHALEWSRYTSRSFKLVMRPGAHDLMVRDQRFVIESINSELK